MNSSNNAKEFLILTKYKEFINLLDDVIENIPKKDIYYKNKLKEISINLLYYINKINNEEDYNKINSYKVIQIEHVRVIVIHIMIDYKPVGKCDYSSIGINASDYYGNMIESVFWNVGEPSFGSYVNADDQYTKEIASYTSNSSKIGLMYASDWGYAIEGFTGVLGYSGSPYNYMNKNWLFSNGYEWTMSAYSSSYPLSVSYCGYLHSNASYYGYAARPVLYLKSNVYVVSGSGSESDPYIIGM